MLFRFNNNFEINDKKQTLNNTGTSKTVVLNAIKAINALFNLPKKINQKMTVRFCLNNTCKSRKYKSTSKRARTQEFMSSSKIQKITNYSHINTTQKQSKQKTIIASEHKNYFVYLQNGSIIMLKQFAKCIFNVILQNRFPVHPPEIRQKIQQIVMALIKQAQSTIFQLSDQSQLHPTPKIHQKIIMKQ
eukprot:TRINITY_DN15397_c0_g1_i2.p1 TRINITY_DN15397_c0_g1~~TRINITY_DN15397_c0_g1_i2.p1  ORF type:complete len:189 (-),score=-7.96 TRINITY_DN15397_c0_g1_i2:62-628(-)